MSEAIKLIDSLEGKKGRTGSMQMTEKQFRYINMLMKDLGWMDENGKRVSEPDWQRIFEKTGFCM